MALCAQTLWTVHLDIPRGQGPEEGSRGKALTKLADVTVSGFTALVVPIEGGRCLQFHTVAKPAKIVECSGWRNEIMS